MVFVLRKLDRGPKTLGEKLRDLRRGQAITLDLIERKTNIQRKYLEALEWGRYEELPEPLYTRNFIRAYARALHADERYFIELYEEEVGCCDLVQPLQTPRQRLRRIKLIAWNRLMKFGGVGAIAIVLFGYLGFQLQAIVAPPEIVLYSPSDAAVSGEARVIVQGAVEGEATVYVNGEQVAVDANRAFRTEIDLNLGVNVIEIEAARRYSRRAHVARRVIFDPSARGISLAN